MNACLRYVLATIVCVKSLQLTMVGTWQIVYPSYKDPCPTISIHKSEIKVH